MTSTGASKAGGESIQDRSGVAWQAFPGTLPPLARGSNASTWAQNNSVSIVMDCPKPSVVYPGESLTGRVMFKHALGGTVTKVEVALVSTACLDSLWEYEYRGVARHAAGIAAFGIAAGISVAIGAVIPGIGGLLSSDAELKYYETGPERSMAASMVPYPARKGTSESVVTVEQRLVDSPCAVEASASAEWPFTLVVDAATPVSWTSLVQSGHGNRGVIKTVLVARVWLTSAKQPLQLYAAEAELRVGSGNVSIQELTSPFSNPLLVADKDYSVSCCGAQGHYNASVAMPHRVGFVTPYSDDGTSVARGSQPLFWLQLAADIVTREGPAWPESYPSSYQWSLRHDLVIFYDGDKTKRACESRHTFGLQMKPKIGPTPLGHEGPAALKVLVCRNVENGKGWGNLDAFCKAPAVPSFCASWTANGKQRRIISQWTLLFPAFSLSDDDVEIPIWLTNNPLVVPSSGAAPTLAPTTFRAPALAVEEVTAKIVNSEALLSQEALSVPAAAAATTVTATTATSATDGSGEQPVTGSASETAPAVAAL